MKSDCVLSYQVSYQSSYSHSCCYACNGLACLGIQNMCVKAVERTIVVVNGIEVCVVPVPASCAQVTITTVDVAYTPLIAGQETIVAEVATVTIVDIIAVMVHCIATYIGMACIVVVHLHPAVVVEYHLTVVTSSALPYYASALCIGVNTHGHHNHQNCCVEYHCTFHSSKFLSLYSCSSL